MCGKPISGDKIAHMGHLFRPAQIEIDLREKKENLPQNANK